MSKVDLDGFKKDLKEAPVIAILRGIKPDEMIDACEAMVEGGVRFIETTMNSPDPISSISRVASHFEGKPVHIGAGTVVKTEQVDQVARAGGTFIISPNFDEAVVKRTKSQGLVSIPGFFTATEGFNALNAGADYLKLFPASMGGPKMVKDLKAVLPAEIMAVGGVGESNIREFLTLCCGVGIGSWLYKPGRAPAELKKNAETLFSLIRS